MNELRNNLIISPEDLKEDILTYKYKAAINSLQIDISKKDKEILELEKQIEEAEKIILLCLINELDIKHAPKNVLIIEAKELSQRAREYLDKYNKEG